MQRTVLIYSLMFFCFVMISLGAQGSKNSSSLKGGLSLRPGVEEYELRVKFRPDLDPDIDDAGNLTLFYKRASLEPIARYNLTFSRKVLYSENDLRILRTPERHSTDETGFNVYNYAGLLLVHTPDSSKDNLLAIAIELEKLDEVEYASLDPRDQPPPPMYSSVIRDDFAPTTPDLVSYQGYRKPDPGIDVDYAWSKGIKGEGILICDEECSWGKLDHANKNVHEDFHGQDIKYGLPYVNEIWADHGKAVMGILVALDNGFGISGAAPKARSRVFSERLGRPEAFLAASDSCKKGDVILMEMQTFGPENMIPSDWDKALWDLVKAATDKGVVVVQAAGNGRCNLDSPIYADYRARGDNGSIRVGAGTPDVNHDKDDISTYGSTCVHVQGWGTEIFSIGYGDFAKYGNDDNQSYTIDFGGTSGASPIVTSAVVLIQSYLKTKYNTLYTSKQMRELLIATGIPQGKATSEQHIGPLPNIKAAMLRIDSLFSTGTVNNGNLFVGKGSISVHNTKIRYFVPAEVSGNLQVEIKLYSINGSLLATLVNDRKKTGIYEIDCNKVGTNRSIAAGIYICRATVGMSRQSLTVVIGE